MKVPTNIGAVYREIFLPPANRGMLMLDHSRFRKRITLAGADVLEVRNQSQVKQECIHDLLDAPRIKPIVTIMRNGGTRTLLLLRPGIEANDPKTHSKRVKSFIDDGVMELVSYNFDLTYDHWSYDEILGAILPEELGTTPPRSFQPIGHVGNLLLRGEFHPHRSIIAQVMLSKTPQLKTVIMKPVPGTNTGLAPGAPTEILVGEPNTVVKVREAGCDFTFDVAATDYRSNMIYAHKRLLEAIKKDKSTKTRKRIAIAEVEAGVGQFTVPAAKLGILVYANNESAANNAALIGNIPGTTAKATTPAGEDFIYPTNLPATTFFRTAAQTLIARSKEPETNHSLIPIRHNKLKPAPAPAPRLHRFPRYFSHFIIPHSAGGISLVRSFRGAYHGLWLGEYPLPMAHVYTYHQSRLPEQARIDILPALQEALGYPIKDSEVSVECQIIDKDANLHRVSFLVPWDVLHTGPAGNPRPRGGRGVQGGGGEQERRVRKRVPHIK